jgi:hypothetical protein
VPIELVAIAAILLAIVGRDTQRVNCSLHAYAHMLSE